MHSRSFKQALKATVRACIVASAFAGASHADWKSPTYPLAITCLVHDSGADFLPPSLWTLENAGPMLTAEKEIEPTDSVRALPLDPVEDCAKHAFRLDNQQRMQKTSRDAVSLARSFWNTALSYFSSVHRRGLDIGASVSRTTGTFLASAANNREAGGCTIASFDQELDRDTDCPWERRISDMGREPDRQVQDLYEDAETPWNRFPSGHNANVFVFTLNSAGSKQRQFSDQIIARDYCVFAPESVVDNTTPSPLPEVVRPSRQAIIHLQRSGSRQLARGMQWLGTTMLRWSSQLESNVRIAEAADGPGFDDRK